MHLKKQEKEIEHVKWLAVEDFAQYLLHYTITNLLLLKWWWMAQNSQCKIKPVANKSAWTSGKDIQFYS